MAVTNDGPLLDIRDLATQVETSHGMLRAVDGVSLSVGRGQAVGIVGESGSGKSLLARSILQLLSKKVASVRGEVWFGDQDLRTLSPKSMRRVLGRDIGMVFQDPMTALNPVMRIGRQLTEPLRAHDRLGRSELRNRAIELLSSVGIPEPERRLAAYPHELSGGMRQRVGIASALACHPPLVIADEPTTALDVTIQRQILDLLTRLQRDTGMALLLITHDLAIVAGRTDVVAVMYAGKIVEVGPTRALFRSSRHPYTRALLGAIPVLGRPSHSRLAVIPGKAPLVVSDAAGCRFATRCAYAQERCVVETPELRSAESTGHSYACFFPTDTELGAKALESNQAAGHSAAGLPLASAGRL